MKKISLLSSAVFLPIFAVFGIANAAGLSDVSSHRNRTAIEYLNQNGIVEGYADGTYRPDESINRAEFTKIIIEATYDEETIENCLPQQMQPNWTYTFFPDVDRNAWYAKYVCVAKMNGIVSGYEDNLFRPNNGINKAESIKILVNAKGYNVPEAVTGNTYSDVMPDAWYAPYVKAAFEANLIEDTGSAALHPGQAMTRAGMSEMTYRALVSEGGVFEIQEIITETPTPKLTLNTLEKVTTADPEVAKDEIIDMLISLANDTNTDLTSSQLVMIDTPEQNYLYNIELARTAMLEKYAADLEEEEEKLDNIDQMIKSRTEIEMIMHSNRALMSLNIPTDKENTVFHSDDNKAYIGLKLTKEKSGYSAFYCYPFIYDSYWKLKLPHVFWGTVDFNTPGVTESCAKEITLESKLKKSDLVPVDLSVTNTFSAWIYLNGHLINNSEGYSYKGGSTFLPLKTGTNTIQIETKNDKSFDENYEDINTIMWITREEFEKNSNLDPNHNKVDIKKDGLSLVEFEMDKAAGRSSKTFTYTPE